MTTTIRPADAALHTLRSWRHLTMIIIVKVFEER
jgi:hypothetical protein